MIKYLIGIVSFLLLFSCSSSIEETENFITVRSNDNSGMIYGVVFDNDTEMPLSGVSVSLYPSGIRTITGSDGKYEFLNLSYNNYVIQTQHADYLSTASPMSVKDGRKIQNDIRMNRGQNSLVVDEHEINLSNVDSQHSLLISNISNKPIKWNLSYDDYFDPATGNVQIYISEWDGELQPYETKELFIRMTISATLNTNQAFPIILQSGNEKIGIVLIPSDNGGKINSKIIGKWDLYRTGHYEDGYQIRQNVPSGAYVLTFKDNLTFELFDNYVSIWLDQGDHNVNLEDVWSLNFSSGSFTYNPMEKTLFLGESFTEGFYYKALNVTDYELILASMDYDENKKEGAIYFFTKE